MVKPFQVFRELNQKWWDVKLELKTYAGTSCHEELQRMLKNLMMKCYDAILSLKDKEISRIFL